MATIKLTNNQLKLIQRALDFYSRVGSLQLDEILDHPTVDNTISERFTPNKKLEIGDDTMRGKIVEIGKSFIKTKGTWGAKEEIKTWNDVDKIKLSPDWNEIHRIRDEIKSRLNEIKYLISGQQFGSGGNYGIYNTHVDESCREAWDMIQIIRHEFWKINPKRSDMTVDSSTSLTNPDSAIEVKLDDIKDIRKQKLKKINK